uniref:S1 motif domain-containing protein n=1 Tax=Strongyloides stercoralis TaxID=6248 RepID=A0A0K0EPH1_STRER
MLPRNLFRSFLNIQGTYRGLTKSSYLLNTETSDNAIDSFDEFENLLQTSIEETKEEEKVKSFPKLLRESKFVELGDFKGRTVVGQIVHKVNNDLYVDVGLKFNAVVQAPAKDNDKYTVGASVLMKLLDPELSERFLGSKQDLTLLEADATLLRLLEKKE